MKGGHLHFHKVITYQLHSINLQTKYKNVHLYSVISMLRKAWELTSSLIYPWLELSRFMLYLQNGFIKTTKCTSFKL